MLTLSSRLFWKILRCCIKKRVLFCTILNVVLAIRQNLGKINKGTASFEHRVCISSHFFRQRILYFLFQSTSVRFVVECVCDFRIALNAFVREFASPCDLFVILLKIFSVSFLGTWEFVRNVCGNKKFPCLLTRCWGTMFSLSLKTSWL